jgi:glutathione S-transferase
VIVIHHLNNSRSQRILWLLEELGLEYDIKRYQRDAKTMLAPPELRRVHPLGKSPVLVEDGVTVAESGALIEYVLDKHGNGRLRPAAGTPERLRFTYWLHYAEGSAMSPLLLALIFGRMPKTPMPFFAKPIAKAISSKALSGFIEPQLKLHMDYQESELAKTMWFAGPDFSAADIQMSFAVEAARARGGLNATRPNLMAYLDRIQARPAYKRALEKGGPYDLLS